MDTDGSCSVWCICSIELQTERHTEVVHYSHSSLMYPEPRFRLLVWPEMTDLTYIGRWLAIKLEKLDNSPHVCPSTWLGLNKRSSCSFSQAVKNAEGSNSTSLIAKRWCEPWVPACLKPCYTYQMWKLKYVKSRTCSSRTSAGITPVKADELVLIKNLCYSV